MSTYLLVMVRQGVFSLEKEENIKKRLDTRWSKIEIMKNSTSKKLVGSSNEVSGTILIKELWPRPKIAPETKDE